MSKTKIPRNPFDSMAPKRASRVWDKVPEKNDPAPTSRPMDWKSRLDSLELQVDWPELVDSTVGAAIKKMSRLLNR